MSELIEKLKQYEKEVDIEKLRKEERNIDEIIRQLENYKNIMRDTLEKIRELKKKIKEINKIKYEEKLKEIQEYINKIKDINDTSKIIGIIKEISDKTNMIEREINGEIKALIEEKTKNIEQINRKLQVFARIILNVLKLNKDIKTFSVPKDKSLSKLNEIESEAIKHLDEINRFVLEELKKINMNEYELNLLVELIDKGEIKINKNNLNDITQIVKMLAEKGIEVRVKI
ncbi:MAG: hypothetical protein QXW80_06135 [Candidatus Micrarchaeia archaeon]